MNRIFKFAFSKLGGIKVYGLIGRSGTGKSFHSKLLAKKLNVDLIVDDGLIIKGDKILAGHSAKRDPNFIAAVKTAVFDDDAHKAEVEEALLKEKYNKILIIGTSEKMVTKIAKRLDLPPVKKFYTIEDIASPEEIETAMRIRYTEGKHVIPVPSIEITRNYPTIVYDSMTVGDAKNNKGFEKTIVRPEFSRPSGSKIDDITLTQMIKHSIAEYDKVLKVKKVKSTENDDGSITINVILQIPIRHYMGSTITDLQQYIADTIEKFGSVMVRRVAIEIEEWS
jgi:hypothetical protein